MTVEAFSRGSARAGEQNDSIPAERGQALPEQAIYSGSFIFDLERPDVVILVSALWHLVADVGGLCAMAHRPTSLVTAEMVQPGSCAGAVFLAGTLSVAVVWG